MKFSSLILLWKMINHGKKSFFSLLNLLECPSHSSFYINDKHNKKKRLLFFFQIKGAVNFDSSSVHLISRIRQLLLNSVQESLSMGSKVSVAPNPSSSLTAKYVNSITNTKLIRFLVIQWLFEEKKSGLFLVSLLVL